jgi:hypothetical protein
MDDGTDLEISAGDVFDIPPGHDAEVTGNEPCVQIDWGAAARYAKPA